MYKTKYYIELEVQQWIILRLNVIQMFYLLNATQCFLSFPYYT